MSRPSVMRLGSQPDLDHPQGPMAAQASLPDISLYKLAPQYPTLSRTRTNFSPLMKPQLSWNTLKRMFTGTKRDEEAKYDVQPAQQMEDQQPSTSSQSDTGPMSQDMSSLSSSQDSATSEEIPTPVNTPPASPKGKAKEPPITRQSTQIVFHPQTLSETAAELTTMKVKVRDYGYPSTNTPAPYCNTPAPSHDLSPVPCQFADPSLALAEARYRISTNSPLSIRGQKARWLLDMGWLTEEDQRTWRTCDWEALNAYDAKPAWEKPRFWYTSKWNVAPDAEERRVNDLKWAQACYNIEKHEIATSRKKRDREQDGAEEKEEPEKKKQKTSKSTKPSSSISSAKSQPKPVTRRRRKVPLPPISAKQYPCPIEYYDPAEYDHEEIRQSQEAMRKHYEAEANEGEDAWEIIEEAPPPPPTRPTPPPASSAPPEPPSTPEISTKTMPPPTNTTGPTRKLGLRRTETLLRF